MSDAVSVKAKLGLNDTMMDPEILTREIDHDFFDDPPEAIASINIEECKKGAGLDIIRVPNEEDDVNKAKTNLPTEVTPMETSSPTTLFSFVRSSSEDVPSSSDALESGNGVRFEKNILHKNNYNYDELHNESGRSSSNVTVHLEMEREHFDSFGGGEASTSSHAGAAVSAATSAVDDFYSIHKSNATSPNYPRPKQCYQLQQRRRSYGSKGAQANAEQFQPMNNNDCGLVGHYEDLLSSSSSSSSSSDTSSELSDSSESELESLDSEDEEFVDMLEKYFDYIDQDSDCSDLTEVSPLSSIAPSPLPAQPVTGGAAGMDGSDENAKEKLEMVTEKLCSATGDLRIQDDIGKNAGKKNELYQDEVMMNFEKLVENDPFFAGCSQKSPKRTRNLPLIISTTETVIVSAPNKVGDAAEKEKLSKRFPAVWPDRSKQVEKEGEAAPSKEESISSTSGCSNKDFAAADSFEGTHEPIPDGLKGNVDSGIASCSSSGMSSKNSNPTQISPKEDIAHCTSSRCSSSWSSNVNNRKISANSSSSSSSLGSHTGGLKRSKRPAKNFTFTSDQMRKIERENHILLRKILDAHNRPGQGHPHGHKHKNGFGHLHGQHNRSSSSSASISRMRQQKRIEHENNILMKRLQTVKPSKEIEQVFNNHPLKN